jgi:hypothetical protein
MSGLFAGRTLLLLLGAITWKLPFKIARNNNAVDLVSNSRIYYQRL